MYGLVTFSNFSGMLQKGYILQHIITDNKMYIYHITLVFFFFVGQNVLQPPVIFYYTIASFI